MAWLLATHAAAQEQPTAAPEVAPAAPAPEPTAPAPATPALPPAPVLAPPAAPPPAPATTSEPCEADETKNAAEGAGMFNLGALLIDCSSLNDGLAAAGYDRIHSPITVIGGEGHAVFDSGFVAGGRGAAILGPSGEGPGGIETDFSGGFGMLELGFAFVHTQSVLFTATGDIGGYGLGLRIGDDATSASTTCSRTPNAARASAKVAFSWA